jgi:Na+-transporting NADH:ubiquinone oxidoreductase subunit F
MDHDHTTAAFKRPPERLGYALNQENTDRAIELGLAEADWYQCPVPRETMRRLLVRKDGPAIRDTVLWFGLIFGTAFLTW